MGGAITPVFRPPTVAPKQSFVNEISNTKLFAKLKIQNVNEPVLVSLKFFCKLDCIFNGIMNLIESWERRFVTGVFRLKSCLISNGLTPM